ncbi:unnamed protein product [Toxocara canis]|uniref:Trichohyalin n=1 Tax=Toxocara canis TaxID=6265 RepID=A0A183VC72_TOXCA|nr:unnamed protein product [Toxocara canis]
MQLCTALSSGSAMGATIAVCRMLLDKRSEREIRKKEVEDLQKEYNESTALQSRLTDELQQKRADLQQLEAEIIMRDQNFRTRQRAIEDEMLSLQDEINTLEEEHRRELAAAEADEHEFEALKKKVLQLREDEQSMGGAKRAVKGEVGKSNTYEEHKGIREANGAVPNAQPTFCFAREGNPEKKPPAKAARQLQLDSLFLELLPYR